MTDDRSNISAPPTTMRALMSKVYCDPSELSVQETATPTAGPGEVLVKVDAVSLNPADWHLVTGTPMVARLMVGLRKPKVPIPGRDVTGTVVAVGADIDEYVVGDRIIGNSAGGTLAEYVALSADRVVRRPDNLTPEAASTLGIAAFTALQGLRDRGELVAGQHVLITGASGGVGTFAIQIAKAFGAEVTAMCRTAHIEMVRSLGADHVIDYTVDSSYGAPATYDVFLDNVGLQSLSESRRVLKPGGRYVMVAGPKDSAFGPFGRVIQALATSPFVEQKLLFFLSVEKQEDLVILRDMAAAGSIVPVIERVLPLEEAPQALSKVGDGHTAGKIVIKI